MPQSWHRIPKPLNLKKAANLLVSIRFALNSDETHAHVGQPSACNLFRTKIDHMSMDNNLVRNPIKSYLIQT
jgi:hypothetical protein